MIERMAGHLKYARNGGHHQWRTCTVVGCPEIAGRYFTPTWQPPVVIGGLEAVQLICVCEKHATEIIEMQEKEKAK